MGGCISRGPAEETRRWYYYFVDNVVNPEVPWLDKPGLAYKAFKGKFVYGVGEGNPWRQEDQAANARDILQSSTLPELADNVTSLLDDKAEKMRIAMDRIKEDPRVQKVQKFSAAAKKVTGRGVDAAFMLVVSKAEKKAPPPPAPRPKKGLDAKHVEKEIKFEKCNLCDRTTRMCVCFDEEEGEDEVFRNRDVSRQLRPSEAAEKAAVKEYNEKWGSGLRGEGKPVAIESLGAARARRASMADATTVGMGGQGGRRASTGGWMSGGSGNFTVGNNSPQLGAGRGSTSPLQGLGMGNNSPQPGVGRGNRISPQPGQAPKKNFDELAAAHKKKLSYVRPSPTRR